MLIICPAWLGYLYQQLLFATSRYQQPSQVLMFIVAAGAALSPVLILLGREHFPVKARPD